MGRPHLELPRAHAEGRLRASGPCLTPQTTSPPCWTSPVPAGSHTDTGMEIPLTLYSEHHFNEKTGLTMTIRNKAWPEAYAAHFTYHWSLLIPYPSIFFTLVPPQATPIPPFPYFWLLPTTPSQVLYSPQKPLSTSHNKLHAPKAAVPPSWGAPKGLAADSRQWVSRYGNGCHAMPTGRCLSWDSHRRSWDRLCCSGSPTCLCAPSGVQRLGAFTQRTAEQIPSPQLVLNKWELPAVNSFRFML